MKTELKNALKAIKDRFYWDREYCINLNNMEEETTKIERALQALDVIISKEVDVTEFKICLYLNWGYDTFEQHCLDKARFFIDKNSLSDQLHPYKHSMTEEEFDLVKEAIEEN